MSTQERCPTKRCQAQDHSRRPEFGLKDMGSLFGPCTCAHTDTSRLRLQDSTGKDIEDIQRYFKNKDILVLYAGSEGGSRESRFACWCSGALER